MVRDPAVIMSTQLSNLVIRASAGAGKTFQLSNRFIALLAADEPLDTILATTFTRKAAGEILDRVLIRLAEAALDEKKLADLAAQVGDATLDRPRCLGILRGVLHQLHRLRVGTLDSFFIQVAQSFSLELGLPPGWQIVEEITDQRLRVEAIRDLLQGEATNDVVRLMHLLSKGEVTRSVSAQIATLVGDLYSIYLEAPAAAWQSLPRRKLLADADLQAAIDALAALPIADGKRLETARDQDLENVRAQAWQAFLEKGLAAKIADGTCTYYKKPVPSEVTAAYGPLVEHAKAVLVDQIANQTEATHRLLERFDAAYQRLKLTRHALRFEDVTRKLGEAAVAERIDEVVYRLDARVSHLLLDEFQDTAPLQWRVLRPFGRRVVAGGRQSFFCVGDVKQAIYGWRGGVAEIFEALDEELPGLKSQPLNQSRRSSQVVIDTVNRVFGNIADDAALARYAEAARRWSKRFELHSTVHERMPGHCRLVVAPQVAEGEDQGVGTLDFAAAEIARLHREAPGHSIGVLVRRNASVARLIYELRAKHDIHASEEGGNPLGDSPAVQTVLSLLTLADHPGDTTARFHVAHSPLGRHVGLTADDDAAAAARLAHEVRRRLMSDGYGPTILAWVESLAADCDRRDLGRLVQLVELAHTYEPQATTRASDFVELVAGQRVADPTAADVRVMTVHQAKGLQFDIVVLPELDSGLSGQTPRVVVGRPNATGEVQHVLRYVPKDLRFLLPPSFRRMFDDQQNQVVEESLCVLYVSLTRAVHALSMIIAPSKANERTIPATSAGLLRAALCDGAIAEPDAALYEHGRADWFCADAGWDKPVGWDKRSAVPPEQFPPAEPQYSVLGTQYSVLGARHPGGTALRLSHPTTESHLTTESHPTAAFDPTPAAIKLAPSPAGSLRGVDRRAPSGLEGGAEMDLSLRLRLDTAAALDRGTLVHAWFELIEWLEDGEPDDAALNEVARVLAVERLDLPALIGQFRAALERPALRAALSRAPYERPFSTEAACAISLDGQLAAPRWQVWREKPFAVRDDEAILSGTFDRLVVLCDGDRPIGADVLDFKTDQVRADDPQSLTARVAYYRPQMEAYRRAAARLFRLEPSRVSVRLAFVEAGVLKSV